MMNTMMQETLLTGTARKAELPGWPAAGKTGTSQDFRDAWFIGYTGHLVTGVWLGNDNSSPTKKTTGGGLPVEIWSKFMKTAHQGVPVVGLPGVSERTADRRPAAVRRRADDAAGAGVQPGRPGPGGFRRRRHRQLADQPAVRPALIFHSSSDKPPASTIAMASGHARQAERVAEDRADHRRRGLRHEAEQRRRGAGAVGIGQQCAGLRLGQGHAHADGVEADRRDHAPCAERREGQQQSHHQSAERHRGSAEAHRPPAAPAHHEARRDRGAHHVARRPHRKRHTERQRRQAVDVLQHERGAGYPGEQTAQATRRDAEMDDETRVGEKAAIGAQRRADRHRLRRALAQRLRQQEPHHGPGRRVEAETAPRNSSATRTRSAAPLRSAAPPAAPAP